MLVRGTPALRSGPVRGVGPPMGMCSSVSLSPRLLVAAKSAERRGSLAPSGDGTHVHGKEGPRAPARERARALLRGPADPLARHRGADLRLPSEHGARRLFP